jgi:hypothetical protein
MAKGWTTAETRMDLQGVPIRVRSADENEQMKNTFTYVPRLIRGAGTVNGLPLMRRRTL